MLSNGPGDPAACVNIIREIRKIYDYGVPTFAICLGHQLTALAVGGEKGEVPARCDRCLVRSTRDGRRILLRYGLCFGQECQVFRVNIAVKFISEEQ